MPKYVSQMFPNLKRKCRRAAPGGPCFISTHATRGTRVASTGSSPVQAGVNKGVPSGSFFNCHKTTASGKYTFPRGSRKSSSRTEKPGSCRGLHYEGPTERLPHLGFHVQGREGETAEEKHWGCLPDDGRPPDSLTLSQAQDEARAFRADVKDGRDAKRDERGDRAARTDRSDRSAPFHCLVPSLSASVAAHSPTGTDRELPVSAPTPMSMRASPTGPPRPAAQPPDSKAYARSRRHGAGTDRNGRGSYRR